MKERFEKAVLVLALLVVGLAGLVVAGNNDTGYPTTGVVATGYNRDRQTAAFRSGLNVADSNSLSTVLGVAANRFNLNGRANVYVSARFSNSAQTAAVAVLWIYSPDGGATQYVIGQSQTQVLTAGAVQDQTTSYFMAPDAIFDGHGATNCYVLLTVAPGAGTVDFWVGSA